VVMAGGGGGHTPPCVVQPRRSSGVCGVVAGGLTHLHLHGHHKGGLRSTQGGEQSGRAGLISAWTQLQPAHNQRLQAAS